MAGDLEEKFVSALKEIGYDVPSNVSLKWMVDNESTREFIQWFSENINSSNYLSEDESIEYCEIESSGNAIKDDELDKEIEKLIPGYEELDGKETEILNELRSELAEAQNHSSTLKTLENKLRSELSDVNYQIKDLKEKNNHLQNKIVKAQEDCFGSNMSLELAMKQLRGNIKKVIEYSDQFSQGVQNSSLIAGFPIEAYKDEIALFECRAQSSIDELKLFRNITKNPNMPSMEDCDLELAKLRKGYESTCLLRLKAESERKGLEYSCDYVKGVLSGNELVTLASNPGIVREMLLETKQKIHNLNQELGTLRTHGADNNGTKDPSSWEGWWSKIKDVVKAFASHKSNQIECVRREVVITEKNLHLKALKDVIEGFKRQCATDLVWMMVLGDEVTRVLSVAEVTTSAADFLNAEQIDRFHRMESMKKSKEKRDYEIHRIESWPLLHSLLNYHSQLGEESGSFFSSCSSIRVVSSPSDDFNFALQMLSKNADNLNTEMALHESSLIDQINHLFSVLELRWKDVSQLRRKIFSGSTSTKAVLCPLEPIRFGYQHHVQLEKLMTKLKALKKNYKSDKVKGTAEKKILRKLWVVFLTNPSELQTMLSVNKVNDENVDKNE